MKYLFRERATTSSLAKLFVIEYASTLADLDSIVVADYGAISLTNTGSSVAQIKEKEYFLHDYFSQKQSRACEDFYGEVKPAFATSGVLRHSFI